ncbi:MAG TPA: NAD+ synthase [Actinomycetota bacterium]|nr:NAD+ synthase [Actinomycetota bacterium]
MRTLRLALAQVNPTVGDLAGNVALVRRWLAKAERAGADLAVFPELAVTGYPPEDLVLKPAFVEENLRQLKALAAGVKETAVVTGYVDRTDRGIHNAAAMLWRGGIRGVYHKVFLPNYGVFDEIRTFTPGDRYPVFVVQGVHVGLSVCEDAWIGDGPVHKLAEMGAEVIVNINASPYHMNKSFERQVLFRQRARENNVFFVYLQTVGGQDELVFDGDSLVYDPTGRLMARGSQFAEDLIVVDLDLTEKAPRRPRRAESVRLTPAPRSLPDRPKVPARSRRAMDPIEEVYSALLLGTRDYCRKNGFASCVVGLSGGIDSSLTAVVAADAVGAENVLGVAMPSRFSSPESLEDAKELATNLGIDFVVVPIEDVYSSFLSTLAEPFRGREPDVTEENLQSRIRGTIMMALSNKFGHLVLATGNKSELATGYSTLYGDMAGGFAVLKDVPKTLVYEVAGWRNASGPTAIPARVFTKPPSAELREGQLDSDSLPQYELLDPIIHAYVEVDRPVEAIIKMGFDAGVVRRVVEMVDRAEYKRRQAPPGVKITTRAFGKDRRLPITNHFREWSRPTGRGRKRR